ncbi:MAG: hypothetical protein GC204_18790 [Chloroflexi bacterium]|nr:hypothetical protein [Chloroflexota bacterium]
MNILIIGGGYAGTLAALRLAGKTRGRSTHITLINASDTFIERIRLHQLAAGQSPKTRSFEKLLRGKSIDFVQGRVTAIDPAQHTVSVQNSNTVQTQTLSYDKLVYALGSMVDTQAVPGIREHALTLGSIEATRQMQAHLQANPNARVIICGGGLTGIELASELAESYPNLSLTLLSRDPLGPNLSKRGHAYVLDAFKRRNITVREGVTIARIESKGVLLENDQLLQADVILWAGSFTVPTLARDAGLAVNRLGQILVDSTLRSLSHPDIFAVGDAAASGVRMACATAMPQGAHTADNLAALVKGQPLQPFRFGFGGRCISLGRHDGIMQIVNADDSPREQIITGRMGALVKELICRYTTFSLHGIGINLYYWPQPHEVVQQPEATPQHA